MDVLKVDFQAADASERFCRSLRETGFGVLYNHPVDQQLIDEVYAEWQEFFQSDIKNKYMFDREAQDGYFPQTVSEKAVGFTHKDLKEFYQYYPWGRYPEELSDKTRQLYTQLSQLATQLLHWVEAHLPAELATALSMPLHKMIEDSPQTMLRILHYPPLPEGVPDGAVRAAAHGDINLLTVLVGATTNGLQVRDAEGLWHDVPCDRESIAVNIGDMLQMATQGYYCSTIHQVINPVGAVNAARLSMPLFLHPRPEVRLSPRYTAEEYLNERLTAIGVR
ncbi:MAG: isopenicillin N synthase family oxygenase [Candidatus Sericytochromatia bacterium]|nr:isopenicillin N synthase family oxygenase [Candidatus Sericytochromatia bacterium]